MKAFNFKPKLYTTLQNYSKAMFMQDLMAGVIVGIVALPLAIAFGIASGVSPEKGIITAIIAGFLISLFRNYLWYYPAIWRSRIDCSHTDSRCAISIVGCIQAGCRY